MKKIYLAALAVLCLGTSCQTEEEVAPAEPQRTEFISETPIEGQVLRTRAAVNPGSVVSQLAREQIPVYIKSAYRSHPRPYLCALQKAAGIGKVDVPVVGWPKDDGNGRQRWIFQTSGLTTTLRAAGGINDVAKKVLISYKERLSDAGILKLMDPATYTNPPLGRIPYFTLNEIQGTDYYSISNNVMYNDPYGQNPNSVYGLKNYTDGDLQEAPYTSNLSTLQKWEIVPMEEFELMEISFDYISGDTFEITAAEAIVNNYYNDSPITHHYTDTYTTETTTESSFSDTQKISTSVQASSSFKTGIPLIASGSINVSVTTTAEYTWNKGGRETVRKTEQRTHSFDVPPYTTIYAKQITYHYRVDLTYYAKVRGRTTGTILYLPGRWEGMIVQQTDHYYTTTP